jgi:hypothetical protein
MPEHTNEEPIRIPGEHWVEFHDTAINLTGIPDDQFRSVDADGNPLVETETLDGPLLEFHDTAINLTGIPDEQFTPLVDRWDDDVRFLSEEPQGPPAPPVPATPPAPKSV